MSDSKFKKDNRPALCNKDPIIELIPKKSQKAILNLLKQHYRDVGQTYTESCPKRQTCIGLCSGRPVGPLIEELKPYVKKIQHLIKDDKFYVQGCSGCAIVKTCNSPCKQIIDYTNRDKNLDDMTERSEQNMNYLENQVQEWVHNINDSDENTGILSELISRYGSIHSTIDNLPWNAISDKRQRLIKMYMFEGKDFRACAQELGYSSGTISRNEFYRGITVLSKYATVRFYIESHRDQIADLEYELLQLRYYEFLTIAEIADKLNIPVGTIRSRLFRFIKRSSLKYSNYVIGNRVSSSNIF